MWPFDNKQKRLAAFSREQERVQKMTASHVALIEAATTTADAAHHVSNRLRQCLQDAVNLFETSIQMFLDAMIVCDSTGKIRAFNQAAESTFAINSVDMFQINIIELFRLRGDKPDINAFWAALETTDPDIHPVRQNGESFTMDFRTARLEQSDGSVLTLILVRDVASCAVSDRVCSIKISDLHTEQRYRALSDLTHDGILIVQNGLIVAANPAAGILFGQHQDEIRATPLKTLILSPLGDTATNIEVKAVRKDGSKLKLLVSSTGIMWNSEAATLIAVMDTSALNPLDSPIGN